MNRAEATVGDRRAVTFGWRSNSTEPAYGSGSAAGSPSGGSTSQESLKKSDWGRGVWEPSRKDGLLGTVVPGSGAAQAGPFVGVTPD